MWLPSVYGPDEKLRDVLKTSIEGCLKRDFFLMSKIPHLNVKTKKTHTKSLFPDSFTKK